MRWPRLARACRGLHLSGRIVVSLTKRQAEVFRLVSAGLSNKTIAQRLGITPGTAKLHVAAVLRSMRASAGIFDFSGTLIVSSPCSGMNVA